MKIVFDHVCVTRPPIQALNDVSIVFDSQACPSIALLGANGAGKSTLLSAVVGLVSLNAGTILVDDLTVGRKNLTAIRKRVGMIFQNADNQLFSQTVGEDVAFGPTQLRLPSEEISRQVAEALALMGITNLADRDVCRLSGGEKRRAALAGVLAMNPEALLLDEPTSMLDPRGCRELAEYLAALPILKIVATHDIPFARRVCPQCVILKNGAVRSFGSTDILLNDHALLLECGLM